MDVVLTVRWQIKVDDQTNLLDIDTTGQKISGDQNTGGTRTELAHDNVTLTLIHISVHTRNGEVTLLHLLLKPVDLTSGIAVNDGLGDGQGLVQITESLEFPFLTVYSNVELLDTLQSQLILLDQNTDGLTHKTLRDLEHIQGHGSREKTNLDRFRKELKNIIDLVLETSRKHLIGLIQEELTNVIQTKGATVDHIVDTTGCSHDNVDTCLKGTDIITDSGTTDTGVDSDVHVVSEGNDDLLNLLCQLTGWGKDEGLTFTEFWVQGGKSSDGESGCFTSTGLGLSDKITA
mmetsp:Transcript_19238/g.27739  ORF Transcript_19238/g.27739 Transcript_19238/m.27739 type:complete len:290 (+) Transcript_19238:189-1058(+)